MTHQSTPTEDERPPSISQSPAQAALPEELERLVRRVVRRTRLRRRERRRVAHELATDFRRNLDEEDLLPTYLGAVPMDAHDGRPLRHEPTDVIRLGTPRPVNPVPADR